MPTGEAFVIYDEQHRIRCGTHIKHFPSSLSGSRIRLIHHPRICSQTLLSPCSSFTSVKFRGAVVVKHAPYCLESPSLLSPNVSLRRFRMAEPTYLSQRAQVPCPPYSPVSFSTGTSSFPTCCSISIPVMLSLQESAPLACPLTSALTEFPHLVGGLDPEEGFCSSSGSAGMLKLTYICGEEHNRHSQSRLGEEYE